MILIRKIFWLLPLLTVICCENNAGKSKSMDNSSQIDTIKISELKYYSNLIDKYQFDKFPSEYCDTLFGLAEIDLNELESLPEEIIENIRKEYNQKKPNFNCKYKVISWGCGSPCQMTAIFNLENGKLIKLFNTSLGAEYHLDSRIIILNPPIDMPIDTNYRMTFGQPEFWEIYNGNILKIN